MREERRPEEERPDVQEPAERKVEVDENYDDDGEDVKRGSQNEKQSPNGRESNAGKS